MALVSFKQGTKKAIKKASYSEGSMYYATDTHEIAFDIGGIRQWHEHSDYLPIDDISVGFSGTELQIIVNK